MGVVVGCFFFSLFFFFLDLDYKDLICSEAWGKILLNSMFLSTLPLHKFFHVTHLLAKNVGKVKLLK